MEQFFYYGRGYTRQIPRSTERISILACYRFTALVQRISTVIVIKLKATVLLLSKHLTVIKFKKKSYSDILNILIYTLSQKSPPFYFSNNSVKN